MKATLAVLWVGTMLSAAIGGLILWSAFNATAAPGQAAAAAVAVGCAVVPYVLTRAIEGIGQNVESNKMRATLEGPKHSSHGG